MSLLYFIISCEDLQLKFHFADFLAGGIFFYSCQYHMLFIHEKVLVQLVLCKTEKDWNYFGELMDKELNEAEYRAISCTLTKCRMKNRAVSASEP